MFLTAFALLLVLLGFTLRSSTDAVLKVCGAWCYGMAVLCSVIVRGVTG